MQLDISYDKFIRTTDSKHEAIVKEFYSRVLANGDIYRADYEGLYCVNCEEYKVIFWTRSYSPRTSNFFWLIYTNFIVKGSISDYTSSVTATNSVYHPSIQK